MRRSTTHPAPATTAPFTQGVGDSGIYFSFDGGASWVQPTYQGWSARTGTPGVGPIGTLPNYFENGLVSDGDPVTVFGPRPDSSGNFSWANGSRLYYSNLTSNFATERKDQIFKGFEAIAVSHADDLAAAAAGDAGAWSDPAIVTERSQSSTTFSDKSTMWVDNAASSPRFGTAYVCYTQFRSQQDTGPEKIAVSHSTDGGDTWSRPSDSELGLRQPEAPGPPGMLDPDRQQGHRLRRLGGLRRRDPYSCCPGQPTAGSSSTSRAPSRTSPT